MTKNEQDMVMTGIDENGQQIFQPTNSYYGEDYWGEVAIGSVSLPEESKTTREVIKLISSELGIYYSALNENDVVLEEGSDE